MRVVAIIQARMGSTRLPGKVLLPIGGRSMLARVVAACRASATLDDVVVATTDHSHDALVAGEAATAGAGVFRGHPHDVLARYLGAARAFHADVVVRVTADCPLLDPAVIDTMVRSLIDGEPADYVSNTHDRSYPRGLDVEVMHFDVLARLGRLARSPAAREHVTAHIIEAKNRFVTRQVVADCDNSDLRLTVDTHADLQLVEIVWRDVCEGDRPPPVARVVAYLRAHPEHVQLNCGVPQKSWRVAEVGHG